MATISFPTGAGAFDGAIHSEAGVTWRYDGTKWVSQTTEGSGGGGDGEDPTKLPLAGGNMTGAITQTERVINGPWDLREGNLWRSNVADIPSPSGRVNGQQGIIQVGVGVTSWGEEFQNTPDTIEVGDILTFYVDSSLKVVLSSYGGGGEEDSGCRIQIPRRSSQRD